MSDLTDKQDDMEQILLNKLPHGSGIDCKWEFTWLVNGKLLAINAFHCMNDAGYYEGFADFTVKLNAPFGDQQDFNLSFSGDRAKRLNKKHMLREYLEETLHYALRNEAVVCGGVQ